VCTSQYTQTDFPFIGSVEWDLLHFTFELKVFFALELRERKNNPDGGEA